MKNTDNWCAVVYAAPGGISVEQMVMHGRDKIALAAFKGGGMKFVRRAWPDEFSFNDEPAVHNACLFVFFLNVHGITPFYESDEYKAEIIAALQSGEFENGNLQVEPSDAGEIPVVSKVEFVLKNVVYPKKPQ